MYAYPYQSPTHFSTPPTNPNPFYLKFVTGNIRICQGCRGSLRCADSTIPEPICMLRNVHIGTPQEASSRLQLTNLLTSVSNQLSTITNYRPLYGQPLSGNFPSFTVASDTCASTILFLGWSRRVFCC